MTTFQEGNKASIEIAKISKPFLRNFMFCPEFFDDLSKRRFYCQVCFHKRNLAK